MADAPTLNHSSNREAGVYYDSVIVSMRAARHVNGTAFAALGVSQTTLFRIGASRVTAGLGG